MDQHELEALYRTQLRPALDAFTRGVRERLASLTRLAVFLVPAGVLASFALYRQMPDNNLVFTPFALVFAYLLLRLLRLRRGYRDHFKREVIAPIVERVDARLRYDPTGSITPEELSASSFFECAPDAFDGEDLVVGRVGETALRFSEVEAKGRPSGPSQPNPRVTLFKGFFIIAEFERTFRGTTVVLPDTDEPLLRHIAHTLQPATSPRGAMVELSDREFERLFAVYTDDEREARCILSTSLVERIMRFRRRTGQTVCLSFSGPRACIAIPSQRDRFEPPDPVAVRNLDAAPRVERMLLENLQAYIDDLRLGVDLVGELNANSGIWDEG
jgi:hypothetical protein